jgi:hypothetical protein
MLITEHFPALLFISSSGLSEFDKLAYEQKLCNENTSNAGYSFTVRDNVTRRISFLFFSFLSSVIHYNTVTFLSSDDKVHKQKKIIQNGQW